MIVLLLALSLLTHWSGRVVTEARAYWGPLLPLPCRKCHRPVYPDQPWTVGHIVPRALGGSVTDRDNQWPEHPRENFSEGGRIGAARTNARRAAARPRRMLPERARGIRGV